MNTLLILPWLINLKILLSVCVWMISRAILGSKSYKTNSTIRVTQSSVSIIKRIYSVASQRDSVKHDKQTISISLSQCIHQKQNRKACKRGQSGGVQQSWTLMRNTILLGQIIVIANIRMRSWSSQLAETMRKHHQLNKKEKVSTSRAETTTGIK